MKILLLVHVLVTWALIGLIWTIQQVHYPLFNLVGDEGYVFYQRAHMARISLLVLPLMMIELVSGFALIAYPPPNIPQISLIIAVTGILLIWGVTIFISAPQHALLARIFDADVHRVLLVSNWVRTGLWTLRGLFFGWVLWRLLDLSPI